MAALRDYEDDTSERVNITWNKAVTATSFTFMEVTYQINSKTGVHKILHGISGHVAAGEFMAIIGSSGAGKTTLLDVLAGRNKVGVAHGTFLLNGQPRPLDMTRVSGYVMQDEAFVATLTVKETLLYALRFRGVRTASKEEAEGIVQDVLDLLNLNKVKDTEIGDPLKRGISGGEARRLCIGVELVLKPSLLFLDEPTSGLDSQNSLRIVKAIKHLCRSCGHTIIATIHQPRSNIYKMFDQLLLLSEGRMVYSGPCKGAVGYFGRLGMRCPETMNPADFLLDMLEGDDELSVDDGAPLLKSKQVGKFPKLFKRSAEYQFLVEQANKTPERSVGSIVTTNSPSRISSLEQLATLTERTWRATMRDKSVVLIRPIAAMAIGLLVGGLFFQQPDDASSVGGKINTMLFLMCVFSLFCVTAVTKFIKEKLLFTRERASGYYTTQTYFISSFLVEFPILLVVVVCYGCVSYWMVGLHPHADHFLYYLALLLLVINVGFGLSQLISSATKSSTLAIAIYMVVLVYSLLLGGFMVSKDKLPSYARWAVYTSYFWYGFSGLIVNEFGDKSYGPAVLQDLDMDNVSKGLNLAALLLMWLLFQFITFIILHYFNKENR